MKMVNRIAFQNMKYHKSRNILIGIAIVLTTLLLFLIPSIAVGYAKGQCAVVNDLYSSWYGTYKELDEELITKLSAYHEFNVYGIDSKFGKIVSDKAIIEMMYLDDECNNLLNVKLLDGTFPKKENEIIVSQGMLKQLGLTGTIGDTITIPYQLIDDEGLGYAKNKQFVICGLFKDDEGNIEHKLYSALFSKEFLETEVETKNRKYDFLFQLRTQNGENYSTIESKINAIAKQFQIPEDNVRINNEYLHANYVDPEWIPILVGIMLIIIVAGIITIYSIFYVGMSDRIREYGKIKAIGATRKQLKQIVLREGMMVACIAIPIGLLLGSIATKIVFFIATNRQIDNDIIMSHMKLMLEQGKFSVFDPLIYLLAIMITLATVWISLKKPMRIASKVSEMEAIRYDQEDPKKMKRKLRKSYTNLSLYKLSKIYLMGNKKNSVITIAAMAATGAFILVVATVISCIDPKQTANDAIVGEYRICLKTEEGNKEHPEHEWSNVIKNNPLNDQLKKEICAIEGITKAVYFQELDIEDPERKEGIRGLQGIPEELQQDLLDGIIEGKVTYEELETGDKVIIDKSMLRWFPDIKIGSKINFKILDGIEDHEHTVTVAAIGDYTRGFTYDNYLLMATEGVQKLSMFNTNSNISIFATEKYEKKIEQELTQLIQNDRNLTLKTWNIYYEQMGKTRGLISYICYAFLLILGVICIMNIINTMIHSVHLRKKQFGMMQAIGMTEHQLTKMLQLEGFFYTLGTLIVSLSVGSLLGYRVYLWAVEESIFDIRKYHYPVNIAVAVAIILTVLQIILTLMLGRSVKKESIIDRIRYSE